MKVFNIKAQEVSVADFKYWAVGLGKKGRAHTYTLVACPKWAKYLEPGTSKKGKPRLNKSSSDAGWIVRISTERANFRGGYFKGAIGYVSINPDFKEQVTVLARGQGALGNANLNGTWDDIIIVSQLDNFWVRVKPSCGDAYIIWFNGKAVDKIPYEKAELLDIDLCCSSPAFRGNLIGL